MLNLGIISNLVMIMNNLRKVQFNLGEAKCEDYTYGDMESDSSGILKERQGWFHCWGEAVHSDNETGQNLQETIAVVEEINSGKIYKVDPNTIVFLKDVNE